MASSRSESLPGRPVFVVDAIRSPFGRSHPEKGIFRALRADALLASLLRSMLERHALPPEKVDDVMIGCVGQHLEQGKNIARLSWLLAGLPASVPGVTVNRLCASSLQAFHSAAAAVASGQASLVLAGGVEHMHHVPMGAALDYSQELLARYEFPFTQMGLTAERLADEFRISRQEQDEFALESHAKAVAASSFHAREIVPIAGVAERADQLPRGDSCPAALGGLKPSFREGGSVTAGNSSPLADGASLTLVASAEACREYGLVPRARFLGAAVVGLDPCRMGLGPVPAIRKLLQEARLELSDVGAFELNEAFAAQALACVKSLGLPREKLNCHGGAIALGHPLGASGTRLVGSLLNVLERNGQEYGIASLCIGHGQGIASLLGRTGLKA